MANFKEFKCFIYTDDPQKTDSLGIAPQGREANSMIDLDRVVAYSECDHSDFERVKTAVSLTGGEQLLITTSYEQFKAIMNEKGIQDILNQ